MGRVLKLAATNGCHTLLCSSQALTSQWKWGTSSITSPCNGIALWYRPPSCNPHKMIFCTSNSATHGHEINSAGKKIEPSNSRSKQPSRWLFNCTVRPRSSTRWWGKRRGFGAGFGSWMYHQRSGILFGEHAQVSYLPMLTSTTGKNH